MAFDRKDLERAVGINLDRAWIESDRAIHRSVIQRRFLSTAAGNSESKRAWFVITTSNNHEKAVYNLLLDAGIQAWLPIYIEKVKRRKGGPKREKEMCIWPGYIFVFVVPVAESWAGISAVKDVKSILTDGQKPIALDDESIKKLRGLVLSGEIQRQQKANAAKFSLGELVRIVEGPFASFPGVIEHCTADDEKVCVDISIFGRSTPVWLGLDQIDRVS